MHAICVLITVKFKFTSHQISSGW